MDKISLGKSGEDRAADYFVSQGYSVLERNFRTRRGEIDLIVQRDGILAFVEVKTRAGRRFGAPMEAVTAKKRITIIKVAQEYMQKNPDSSHQQMRFDVVECMQHTLKHLPDAYRP
ncbi:MAG: YraN family protein [Christensenellales bacterium]|jgi:putative endonuclease